MPILLKDIASDALHARLAPLGVTPRVARQIQAAAVRRSELPENDSTISPSVLRRVRAATVMPLLTTVSRLVSPTDGFVKYLLRGQGPEHFEAVRIPLLHRAGDPKYVACVSSQVGCAMGCAFCGTGRLGLARNLEAWEMVEQVALIRRNSPHPVRGVVFMGMGEPFMNYDAVLRAARIVSEPCGLAIARKAITISTVGIVPAIRRFTAEGHAYRLVVSLTCADPARRRQLMPVEDAHPTAELFEALRAYQQASGRRVTLAWTMIAGFNTRPEDARQLAALLGALPAQLDLIDVNDPTGRFQPPTAAERNAFRDALRAATGIPVARRYSGGADIHAACGMLAAVPTP
jgi:23S rRNA (adenine2503-C2)-methyltransferase